MNQAGPEQGHSFPFPPTPFRRWTRPLRSFLHIESASGGVLLVCTVVALVLANSPWANSFAKIWQTPGVIGIEPLVLNKPLLQWINDGLMTIFFFVVGLEIKREIVNGELRDPRKAALPVIAALGGMVAPACLFLLLHGDQLGREGWGIPMATDIAFVVGFLALLGRRVPLGLKITLLSLAIADDIGAIIIIALFYSSKLALGPLGLCLLGFGLILVCRYIGVRSVLVYFLIGAGIWLACYKSGIHPTVAGVFLGLMTPTSVWVEEKTFLTWLSDLPKKWLELGGNVHTRKKILSQVSLAARETISPLERLETSLHPWVAFVIMPLFALANAGVAVKFAAFGQPVALAVTVGLVLGKPLGIVLFSWLAVQVGLARLPSGVNWRIMWGGGCLAGIGFTMALFIANLALKEDLLDSAKIGILMASLLSVVFGLGLLYYFLPPYASGPELDP